MRSGFRVAAALRTPGRRPEVRAVRTAGAVAPKKDFEELQQRTVVGVPCDRHNQLISGCLGFLAANATSEPETWAACGRWWCWRAHSRFGKPARWRRRLGEAATSRWWRDCGAS
eukprot:scaffold504_cov240-Pinguiococcus_pyrenoidosus.AAC.8